MIRGADQPLIASGRLVSQCTGVSGCVVADSGKGSVIEDKSFQELNSLKGGP